MINKTSVTLVATSGSAADAAQAKILEYFPDSTRMHHVEGEQFKIRRPQQLDDPEATDRNTDNKPTAEDSVDDVESSQAISKAVREFQLFFDELRATTDWNSSRTFREHYSTSGLNFRMLQNCRFIKNDLEAFRDTTEQDPHAEFRGLLEKGFAELSDEERTRYKELKEACTVDTLRKTSCVVTTPSQTANTLLKQARKTVVGIHDEVCQASDLEP